MTNKEKVYARIRAKVSGLYEKNQTITIGDLLKWVNSDCKDLLERPYGNLRRVIKAAHDRGSESEQEALQYAILNKDGKSCLS